MLQSAVTNGGFLIDVYLSIWGMLEAVVENTKVYTFK